MLWSARQMLFLKKRKFDCDDRGAGSWAPQIVIKAGP